MSKTILILGGGRAQIPAIERSKALGFKTIAIDPDPDAAGNRTADIFYALDLASDKCVDAAKVNAIDAVITLAADYPVPMVAKICDMLGLSGLSREAALASTDKKIMRDCFSRSGLPSPQYITASSREEAIQAAHDLASDLIVKPVVSSGGRGVTFLDHAHTELEIDFAFQKAKGFSENQKVLFERYVDGREYSVEMLHFSGKAFPVAITDKVTSGLPYFVETGHLQPTCSSTVEQSQMIELAVQATRSLGIDNVASHTEIKMSVNGPYLIEVAARMGGGFISSHLVTLSSGIDYVKASIEVALGLQPNLESSFSQGAAIRFIPHEPGIFGCLPGMDEIENCAGFHEVDIYLEPGLMVEPLMDSTGRIGHVICTGKNAAVAWENVNRAIDVLI